MDKAANTPVRLGMLTPSSNTVLEPTTAALLAAAPDGADDVSVHVSRFRVTEIALSENALGQFDDGGMLRAAELLADARVDVIAWNGTSAGWLGYERDERLCERITAATGIPACTTVLAYREIFQRTGARRIGLVTPYLTDVQDRIRANWTEAGFACPAERHLGRRDNFSFAQVSEDTVASLVREVAAEGCDAVAVVCTNMRGALAAAGLEAELGLPIYDSVAVTLWKCLATVGLDPSRWRDLGRVFDLPAAFGADPARAR
ncbi:aspartate/glutamate racemase family protein [Methylobacterium sp. NEAU 140]|uniref:maleate cis-trans isomerase family protein n=1 Tax=Methylobacterium sp. NEAU 140 TaxID=3064945 RepID=UPI0027325EB7|nr:aspartate/glutamate racemase family protein [Methylobacterium sp. NEAU 140]MDP4026883.1 aspartate/glutamate racemase family protein [Methylobacterium sp. NEAU 140]